MKNDCREAARSAGARYEIGKAHKHGGPPRQAGQADGDSVAEHDQVSEVTISSTARRRSCSARISSTARRPATLRTVVEFNGPGNNGSDIRGGVAYQIEAGDVIVIPAGTGHWFTKIDDHIDYLMVRIDPDKVTPLRSQAQSMDYLSKPAPAGQ